jgi:hypothetical protein
MPHRSLLRSLPFFSLLVVAVGIVCAFPRTARPQVVIPPGACPHQGRDPNTVVVDPTSSAIVNQCDRSQQVSMPGMSGSTQSSWSCPTWETTGLNYNPVVAKLNVQVTDSQMVENKRVALRCARPSWFFGIYSNIYCESYREDVIEIQIHVLAEGMCEDAVAP